MNHTNAEYIIRLLGQDITVSLETVKMLKRRRRWRRLMRHDPSFAT